jgi:tRNA-dihydrouridine synthase
MFDDALKFYNNSIAYNGDIESLEDYGVLLNQFPEINHVMIGRGVLGNLFLPSQIKGIVYTQQERTEMLGQFRQEIENLYIDILSGEAQLLQKLKPFWEYFSNHFNNDKKVFKMIKKASSIKKFEQAVDFAFQQGIKEI